MLIPATISNIIQGIPRIFNNRIYSCFVQFPLDIHRIKTGIISNSTDGLPEWRIALQVAITLYIVIIFAKCLGASLPILAKNYI